MYHKAYKSDMTIASVPLPGNATEDWNTMRSLQSHYFAPYRKLRYADLSELRWYYRGVSRSVTIAKIELPQLLLLMAETVEHKATTSSSSPSSACIRTSVSMCGTLALKGRNRRQSPARDTDHHTAGAQISLTCWWMLYARPPLLDSFGTTIRCCGAAASASSFLLASSVAFFSVNRSLGLE